MMDVMKDVGKALIPPGIDPELAWRLVMAGSICALGAFSIWAIGIGGGGFALAGEVDKISKRQLETRLDDVHYVLCMEGADPQLLTLARELEREYLQVNEGHPYVPNCSLLLKLKR